MSKNRPAPPLARQVNIASVFTEFWVADVLSVSDLMEATGLTRATVHAVCGDLVRLGWVRTLKAQRESGTEIGRPAKRFTLNERAGYVLGIDMGDTSINATLTDLRGTTVIARHHDGIATETLAADRVRLVGGLVEEMLAEASLESDQVLTAGVGVAAPVSQDGRAIGFDQAVSNPYWASFRFDVDALQQALHGITPLLANDANLAALGEHWRGEAQGVGSFIALLAGNRLGAGLMDSGRLLHGHAGGAGEMSFLDDFLDEGGADGLATLARRWAVAGLAAGQPTVLTQMSRGRASDVTAEMVFAAAQHGDDLASQVLDRLADRFARLITMVSIFLNPELVIIGGAVAQSATVLLEPIQKRVDAMMVNPSPRIVCSTFGDSIVTVGAVRLALNQVRKKALSQSWLGAR